jgi:outer membrane receptor protein involved in Fe transport
MAPLRRVGEQKGRVTIMASRNLISALLLSSCIVAPGVAAAQDAATTTVEEVVVTGQRASDRDSLLKKRDAVSAVEVVSANDVGKLPDQNVAEAVRRLSGVSVATDKGEGRYLIIRGIEPNLANVTINNQTASAPEPESRNVKLDDIPSALIGSVTVIKSLTPDLDANAIAGQVDINTLTAFDRNKTILSARVVRGIFDATDASRPRATFRSAASSAPIASSAWCWPATIPSARRCPTTCWPAAARWSTALTCPLSWTCAPTVRRSANGPARWPTSTGGPTTTSSYTPA